MKIFSSKFYEKFSFYVISGFLLLAMLNPVFKKYDYGVGFPLVLLFSIIIFILCIVEFDRTREPAGKEKILLSIFAVCLLISFKYSLTKNTGLPELMAYLSMIPLYLLYAHQRLKWRIPLLKVIAVRTLLSCAMGFVIYVIADQPRMVGPFFNIFYHANFWPNAFALFLLLTWPVFILFFKEKWNLPAILALSFVLSALLLTFSRGALVAFFGQLFLFFIFYVKHFKVKFFVTFSLIIIFTLAIFSGANFLRGLRHSTIDVSDRLEFENQEDLTSKQERIDFWLGAVELIKERPWFGSGPSSFRYVYNGIQTTFLASSDHPHNLFLKIGVENGLIALAVFAFFILLLLFKSFHGFKKLSAEDKDTLLILWICVSGALAHSLIDYNFNFYINLLLLFIYLAFIRSLLISTIFRFRKMAVVSFLISLLIFSATVYEGGLAIKLLSNMDNSDVYSSNRELSLYPRYEFLKAGDEYLKVKNFTKSLYYIEKEIALNPLDSQAYYLKGVIYCNEKFSDFDLGICIDNFLRAQTLNPMNEIMYYRDYLRALIRAGYTMENSEFKSLFDNSLKIVNLYFDYVENNVHFTAYTENVEAAEELIDMLLPYLPAEKVKELILKKTQMHEKAEQLRAGKAF